MDGAEVIGIDLGGTAIKLGRFNRQGICLESLTVPTPQPALPLAVVEAMVKSIVQLVPNRSQIVCMGVGTPGPSDVTHRIARLALNLPEWHNIPLADLLEAQTGIPTVVENDANCAAIAEAWLGATRGFQNFILLTLGTGVGGAIFLNGQLFTGHQGAAGELGVITFNPEGPPCNSGNRGSFEQYASIRAIRRLSGKEPDELALLAQKGDKQALACWETYGRNLGIGLSSLIYVLTPEAIAIGGGISASAEFFFPSAIAEIERRVLPPSREGLQLVKAELGNQAGIVGAAKLAWDLSQILGIQPSKCDT
ncbi:ROK family protein [Merismopedia glauca]|uniref:Glucokinase n=1 Tax=Merismopedia glauca CCAP 1448/3 TaxID=1296344 RepID=A0A2T1C6D3_9CYAN|nr:glucokinase [Merismopedia glauca CCAP 1448/3]